jgi:hypothetical protein
MSRCVSLSRVGAVSTNARRGLRGALGNLVIQVIIYFGLGPSVRHGYSWALNEPGARHPGSPQGDGGVAAR